MNVCPHTFITGLGLCTSCELAPLLFRSVVKVHRMRRLTHWIVMVVVCFVISLITDFGSTLFVLQWKRIDKVHEGCPVFNFNSCWFEIIISKANIPEDDEAAYTLNCDGCCVFCDLLDHWLWINSFCVTVEEDRQSPWRLPSLQFAEILYSWPFAYYCVIIGRLSGAVFAEIHFFAEELPSEVLLLRRSSTEWQKSLNHWTR